MYDVFEVLKSQPSGRVHVNVVRSVSELVMTVCVHTQVTGMALLDFTFYVSTCTGQM